jgi:hypothetical protein
MKTPEDVLTARQMLGKDGFLKPEYLTTWGLVEAMKEYARIAVTEQRDLMMRHLNMRNVPTPWTK